MAVKKRLLKIVALEADADGNAYRHEYNCGCVTVKSLAAGISIWIHVERCDQHPPPKGRPTIAIDPIARDELRDVMRP